MDSFRTTRAESFLPVGPSSIDGYASFENFQIERDFFRALRRSRLRAALAPLRAALTLAKARGEPRYRVPTLRASDLDRWTALYGSTREGGPEAVGGRLVGNLVHIDDTAEARVRLALGTAFGYEAGDIVVVSKPGREEEGLRGEGVLAAALAGATGNGSWR